MGHPVGHIECRDSHRPKSFFVSGSPPDQAGKIVCIPGPDEHARHPLLDTVGQPLRSAGQDGQGLGVGVEDAPGAFIR